MVVFFLSFSLVYLTMAEFSTDTWKQMLSPGVGQEIADLKMLKSVQRVIGSWLFLLQKKAKFCKLKSPKSRTNENMHLFLKD